MAEKEKFFTFTERWEQIVTKLPPEELKALMLAVCAFAFRGEEPPEDMPLAASMAMMDIRTRISWEKELREVRQAAGSKGGKNKQNQANPEQNESKIKQNQANPEQNESKIEANSSAPGIKGMEEGNILKKNSSSGGVKRKGAAFLFWTPEEFRREADAAAASRPELKNLLPEFCDYWLAEHRSGKLRFQTQETFSMAGRLATWARNAANPRAQVILHPAQGPRSTAEAMAMIPEVNS